jgi:hypothetical protein
MLASEQVEELICLVAALDRESLVDHLHDYHASFPIDFTDDFLTTVPLDRLRHIFVALCLQQKHVPQILGPIAA